MTDKDIYKLIGSIISESIIEEWQKVVLNIKSYPNDWASFTGSYINYSSSEKELEIDVMKLRSIKKGIYELQNIMKTQNNIWNRAIFTLTSDNKFDMEFIWDQELDDEIKRNS